MEKLTYCKAVLSMEASNVHRVYHDHHYGFPIHNDNELFERLILEINQAGLSWDTILKKQENFKKAYNNFEINKVANYRQKDFDRLMNDAGIIRNRLKIQAAIDNANTILAIQNEFGSFKNWIEFHHPMTREAWVKIFKKTFKFTGGEIVNEFLMSTGYLPGAHEKECPVFEKTVEACALFHNQ